MVDGWLQLLVRIVLGGSPISSLIIKLLLTVFNEGKCRSYQVDLHSSEVLGSRS
jgi:hypothetical protein